MPKFNQPAALPAEASITDFTQLDSEAFKKAVGLEFEPEETDNPPESPAAPEQPAAEAPKVEEQPAPEPAPAAEAKPEGEAEAEPVAEAKETEKAEEEGEGQEEPKAPLTKFSIADAEGEVEVPELFLSFDANKKHYEKVPLEKVVALAQMGVYNHEREQERVRERVENASRLEQLQSELEEARYMERANERLLSDPLYYERARELYLSQHTPEHRAARAEQALEATQASQRQADEDRQIATFVYNDLAPAVESLQKQFPAVSQQELIGQYTLLTAPLMVRGRIPLQKLAAVKSLVEQDLTAWAQSVHLERSASARKVAAKQTAAVTKLAATKRQIARTVQPTGHAAPPAPAKPKEYETVDAWLNDLGGVLPGTQS